MCVTALRSSLTSQFWRGAMLSDGRRELVKIANGTVWGDVDGINWERPDEAAPRIDMWDFCRYRYLAHTKGINEWCASEAARESTDARR